MQEFRVHFMPGTGQPQAYDTSTSTLSYSPFMAHDSVTAEGAWVNTQSTNGAGLVAEIFKTSAAVRPTHVFSNVLFVESLGERDVPGEEMKQGSGGRGEVPWVPRAKEKR